jgi:3-oxoacyl-[acyl-carrier protein] reductase
MLIDLSGMRALVAGSTQGIGKAIAQQYAHSGAELILVARSEDRLKETISSLPAPKGQRHAYLVADFDEPESLAQRLRDWDIDNNPIHVLLNNTGGPAPGRASEAGISDFELAFKRHLMCNHILLQFVIPGMKKMSYGRVINIVSTSVKQPIPGLGVSNTIRGAVASWAKTLAGELAPYGITVNNILPGATTTERLSSIIKGKAGKLSLDEDEIEREMLSEIPAARFAEPREPAYLATFLASSNAAYINGTSIAVDGGRTLCL